MRLARRVGAVLAGVALFALPALSTWSIVVVDTRTKEVCVATATCVPTIALSKIVPVIVPERGCAAVQAAADPGCIVRPRIWRGLHDGLEPAVMLRASGAIYAHKSRQYGIVSLDGTPVTWSGSNTSQASGGVTGIVGDLRYAIQGNILVDPIVWLAAEQALVSTPGDLSQKVMAAMEAARSWGGDGRCSCSPSDPTGCGAPPPGFVKSADSAYIGLARVGDGQGVCKYTTGCANGDYFLALQVVGKSTDPDPVITLQGMYARWRAALAGRADQLLSDVAAQNTVLVADGQSWTGVDVRLVDVDGVALTSGGLQLTLERLSKTPAATVAGAVVDNGDGTYAFPLTATTTPGTDVWRVSVTDAVGTVVLQPDVTIRVDPLVPLHIGVDSISAAEGGTVPFTLNLGPAQKNAGYFLLASASGTQPGTPFGSVIVPLHADRLYHLTLVNPGPPVFVGFSGVLDGNGHATASFAPPPGFLAPFAGMHTDWAAAMVISSSPTAAGPVGLEVLP